MLYNPFEQFLVMNHFTIEKKWDGFFSFLNHNIYINDTIIIIFFFILFNYILYLFMSFEKNRMSKSVVKNALIEIYDFVYNIVKAHLTYRGEAYFPFFFYLFLFIMFSNLLGILPYSFTITSHLSITFTLSFIVWFGSLIIGFVENGVLFFGLVLPRGVPLALVPFLVGVETISYIFRSVSLALRLFANIVAGHILLDTLALSIHKLLFPTYITFTKLLISIIPFLLCIILILFECVVALLQAYIFLILSNIYLKEAYHVQKH